MSAEAAKIDQPLSEARAPQHWTPLVLKLLVLCVVGGITGSLVREFVVTRPYDVYPLSREMAKALEELLLANRIPPENILRSDPTPRKTPSARWYFYDYEVRIPATLSAEGMEDLIDKAMRKHKVDTSDFFENGAKQGLTLSLRGNTFANLRIVPTVREYASTAQRRDPAPDETQPPPSPLQEQLRHEEEARVEFEPMVPDDEAPPPLAPQSQVAKLLPERDAPARRPSGTVNGARLAIILDDGGYGGKTTEAILALPPTLTLAILPNTNHGTDTARRAGELGFEIMLHMPMENTNPKMRHDGQLDVDMSEEELISLTLEALAQVPGATGVNNHMGSEFTTRPKAVSLFLHGVSERSLFFIDSRTTPETRAYGLAQAFGIPSAERDIFLDHDKDPALIRKRFQEAVDLAKREGSAIAIAHFRPNTVAVLQELLPTLEAQGVRLVHASELVE